MRSNKGYPFMHIEQEVGPSSAATIRKIPAEAPVFSEATLYPTLGKGDARFVLGVAEEYDHIIEAIGPKACRAILRVRPRLVKRLKVGDEIVESLEDCGDEQELRRDEEFPPEVTLDGDVARELWYDLHREYQNLYDPEKSMDSDKLRAYNALTAVLGHRAEHEREKERKRLPQKLEKQKTQRMVNKQRQETRQEVRDALLSAGNAADRKEAVERFQREYEKGKVRIS